MKKILWLSNCHLSNTGMSSTGTWLFAMMEALLKTGQVKLYNVTQGGVKEFTKQDWGDVGQWVIPRQKINNKGLPASETINFFKKIEEDVNPDLIHIWGTESLWGMLGAKKVFNAPVLLDMQGILYAYAKVFFGGLTTKELLQTTGLKELLLPVRHLYFRKKEFERRGIHEKFVIHNTSFISVQSAWVEAHILSENPGCRLFHTGIILRKEFYNASPWQHTETKNPVIFTSSSGSTSYKGLHVLFRALAVIKQKFPSVKLKIAGTIIQQKKIQDGYTLWLIRLAKKLGVYESVEWLGPLNAAQIVQQFQQASVVVIPSVVETYCLALAEAMIVGVPSVVSYSGAMPELADHNKSALYFPTGDFMSCAWQVEKILTDKTLCEKLSVAARATGIKRNDPDDIVNNQLRIYNEIIGK
ncbi:glycosyl transferase [Terrimonas sp.]|uniref:glycosyltransferase family 4 protein n=1 Tax=Terrimonas sp. TaxID=1914338 RepID=UPI000D51917A|nr:glycosyltransferase [Terrimonas sp.]PVD52654.1 glycosyl transferase [Terrimonas sp.]